MATSADKFFFMILIIGKINLYGEWIFKHFHLSSSTIAFSPHILFPWPLKILAALKFSNFFEFFHSSKSHPLNELLVSSFWKSLRCYYMYVSTLGIMIFVMFVRWIIQFPPNSISIPCVTACLLNFLFFFKSALPISNSNLLKVTDWVLRKWKCFWWCHREEILCRTQVDAIH